MKFLPHIVQNFQIYFISFDGQKFWKGQNKVPLLYTTSNFQKIIIYYLFLEKMMKIKSEAGKTEYMKPNHTI